MDDGDVGTVGAELRLRVAANLKAAREREGLSQPSAAELMRQESFSYTQQTLARIEAGQRKVPAEELVILARIYNVAVDQLARPEGLALAGADILRAARSVRESTRALHESWMRRQADRDWLERLLARAEEKGFTDKLTNEVRAGRHALSDGSRRLQEKFVPACTSEYSLSSLEEIPEAIKKDLIFAHQNGGHQHCKPIAPDEQPAG